MLAAEVWNMEVIIKLLPLKSKKLMVKWWNSSLKKWSTLRTQVNVEFSFLWLTVLDEIVWSEVIYTETLARTQEWSDVLYTIPEHHSFSQISEPRECKCLNPDCYSIKAWRQRHKFWSQTDSTLCDFIKRNKLPNHVCIVCLFFFLY